MGITSSVPKAPENTPSGRITPKKDVLRQMKGKIAASKQKLYDDQSQQKLCLTTDINYNVYNQFLTSRSNEGQCKATEKSLKNYDTTHEGTIDSPLANSKYSIPNSIEKAFPNYTEEVKNSGKKRNSHSKRKSKHNVFTPPPKKVDSTLGSSAIMSHQYSHPKFDQVSLLPPEVVFKILTYGVEGFRSFLCVNPSWYCSAMDAFDSQFNMVENKFINAYTQYLLYKYSYTTSSVMKFCDVAGTRVDRVIRFEPLFITKGQEVTISYSFKYLNDRVNKYKAIFILDSLKRRPRTIWAHLNECNVLFLTL